MTIKITGKHIEIGENLSDFTKNSLENLVNRYVGDIFAANVVISKNHNHFMTDISLHVNKVLIVHCKGQDEDAYKSVNMAIGQLEARIKRYKNRLRNLKRHHHEEDIMVGKQYIVDHKEEDQNNDNPLIIAEMDNEVHKLSVGEAVMQLDLTDSPILLFQNAVSDRVNLVYRRSDGNIGWIDPSLNK